VNERTTRIMSGLVAIVFLCAAVVFGVKAATGSLRPVYHLDAAFTSAGQGLIRDSDVKIHGVDIGRVSKVRLDHGRALVTLEIDKGEKIPETASATIRPKTLFGEKFVDIDPGEADGEGPYLHEDDRITKTLGGFELERVLADAYPILKAVDPAELAVVLDTLAEGGRGEGPAVNRQIANWQKVAAVNAAHDADTQEFLDDLATLSDTLADKAPALVGTAQDLNDVLPTLNSRGDELSTVLEQASRLSADAADLLEANRPFLNKSVTEGGKVIQTLYDERAGIPPLVKGLRQFLQTLAEATDHTSLDQPDGSRLAAIKLVFGGGAPCGRTSVGCPLTPPDQGATPTAPTTTPPARAGATLPPLPQLPQLPGLPVPQTGAAAITSLLGGLLGP
jgi:phospholipid/cholesterol/gamma-HCH transport system substrate-binding protein